MDLQLIRNYFDNKCAQCPNKNNPKKCREDMCCIRECLDALDAPATPPEDGRKIIVVAAKIANDYIQALGDQSRTSEILGRGVQAAILDSKELDKLASTYTDSIRKQCADKAVDWVMEFDVIGAQEMPDLRSAIMQKE